jgi:hypothetical protein
MTEGPGDRLPPFSAVDLEGRPVSGLALQRDPTLVVLLRGLG